VSAALVQEGGFSPTQSRVRVNSQRALPGLAGASDLPRVCVGPRVFIQNDNHDDEGADLRTAVGFLANEGRLYSATDEATTSPRREEKAQHAKETPISRYNAAYNRLSQTQL
jgi:hypothetical protein